MTNKQCDNCLKSYPADKMLYCTHCGKCYCPSCAHRMCVCECAGDLTFFD